MGIRSVQEGRTSHRRDSNALVGHGRADISARDLRLCSSLLLRRRGLGSDLSAAFFRLSCPNGTETSKPVAETRARVNAYARETDSKS